MSQELEARLKAIRWELFSHPCGFDSREIPALLLDLNNDSQHVSLKAANRLWNVVAHQGNVGPNAVPTLPFLLDALERAAKPVQDEILDIIYRFSWAIWHEKNEPWSRQLRAMLSESRSQIALFLDSENEELREWAEMILERIDAFK